MTESSDRAVQASGARLDVGLGIAAAMLLGVAALSFSGTIVDDAYISFRYARHLAMGDGLVFNPGEAVEGYTNFSWTLLMAAALRLGFRAESAATVVGWGAIFLTLFVIWRLGGRLFLSRRRKLLALFALSAAPSLSYWATAGLETPLYTLLSAIALWSLLHAWRGGSGLPAALVLLALPMTRPDGVLLVAPAIVVWWFAAPSRRQWLVGVSVVVVGGAFYAGWKLVAFGSLLPNTFFAKVLLSGQSVALGATYLAAFLRLYPWAVLGLVASVWILLSHRVSKLRETEKGAPEDDDPGGGAGRQHGVGAWGAAGKDPGVALLWLIVAQSVLVLLFALAVGGDIFPYLRFLTPLLPGLALAAVSLPWSERRLGWLMVVAVLIGAFQIKVGKDAWRALAMTRMVRMGELVGRYLDRRLPKHAVIAVNAAGALPYYARRITVDMLGLTDAHIARNPVSVEDALAFRGHAHHDGAYVLRRRPSVIIWGNTVGREDPLYPSDHALAQRPAFRRDYRLLRIPLSQIARALDGAKEDNRPKTELLGTLIGVKTEEADPRVVRSMGLFERRVPAGLLTLCELWRYDPDVLLWIRRDVTLRPIR